MKNNYKIFTLLILMLFSKGLTAQSGIPILSYSDGAKYVLYQVRNLTESTMEGCAAYLVWNKPQTTGGVTPAGLMGYKIYRNGTLLHYTSNPDSLIYYDYVDDIGSFTDSATAYYDLTSYGSPGLFGESPAQSVTFQTSCGAILPFSEHWDAGIFAYQTWTFEPSQGNWIINTNDGNPSPTATFNGTPTLINYDHILKSLPLDLEVWSCANISLEFDSRGIVNNPTLNEKLIIEIYYGNTWYPKDTLVNDSSTGWVHHKLNITSPAGTNPKIGFRATGNNSADLVEWDVDNIIVSAVCFPPPDYTINRTNNIVHLTWGVPCQGKRLSPNQVDSSIFMGYNVYRSNANGQAPYSKMTQSQLTTPGFNDTILLSQANYCYYVTAIYQDEKNPGITLCESPGDTLCIQYTSGISEQNNSACRVFPNPVSDVLHIETTSAFNGVDILNFVGEKVYSSTFPFTKELKLPFQDYPNGIYLVKVKFNDKVVVTKVIKD
jgi:hypothetical protein